ncbi:hypothetical protein WJX74_004456 [Apatococcus lobatus]|uniref:Uncharacterized protein n=1 Tax=Apatococcus lobatus TaxID=904363 RepID=A0AAW1QJK3_9CHLO
MQPARQQGLVNPHLQLSDRLGVQPWSRLHPEHALVHKKYKASRFLQTCVLPAATVHSRASQGEGLPELPCCLQECHHFVNLTNGAEALPLLSSMGLAYSFCRIQSTALEQKRFEALLSELDSNLLLNLALGKCCLVYDLGSRNRVQGAPKAIWYGLEFIRFVLEMLWFRHSEDAYLRGVKSTTSFYTYINDLSSPLTRRLKYYKRFMDPDLRQLQLYGVYKLTQHDSDLQFHRRQEDQIDTSRVRASCESLLKDIVETISVHLPHYKSYRGMDTASSGEASTTKTGSTIGDLRSFGEPFAASS